MRYLIVLSILISIFIPKMQLGAFDFYKQWEKRERKWQYNNCCGLYIGKVSNRNLLPNFALIPVGAIHELPLQQTKEV